MMAGWFAVMADIHRHPKIVALPSPAARWAFIVTLAEGKSVGGRWVNQAHYRACVPPSEARHLEALIKAGLITKDGDALLIHDWEDYQRDPDATGPKDPTAAERQRRRRDRQRQGQGLVGVDGVTVDGVTDTVTSRVTSRAVSVSTSMSRSNDPGIDEPYQVPGPVEPYATLEVLTRFPVQRVSHRTIQRLDGLCDRRTVSSVVVAMRAVAASITPQPPSPDQLVYEAIKHLEPYSNGRKPALAAKGGVSDEEAERAFGRP